MLSDEDFQEIAQDLQNEDVNIRSNMVSCISMQSDDPCLLLY